MRAFSITYFKQHVDEIVEATIEDCDSTIITLDNGEAAVLVPLAEYSSWQETAYLLSSPANAQRLMHSVRQARSGEGLIDKTQDH